MRLKLKKYSKISKIFSNLNENLRIFKPLFLIENGAFKQILVTLSLNSICKITGEIQNKFGRVSYNFAFASCSLISIKILTRIVFTRNFWMIFSFHRKIPASIFDILSFRGNAKLHIFLDFKLISFEITQSQF